MATEPRDQAHEADADLKLVGDILRWLGGADDASPALPATDPLWLEAMAEELSTHGFDGRPLSPLAIAIVIEADTSAPLSADLAASPWRGADDDLRIDSRAIAVGKWLESFFSASDRSVRSGAWTVVRTLGLSASDLAPSPRYTFVCDAV